MSIVVSLPLKLQKKGGLCFTRDILLDEERLEEELYLLYTSRKKLLSSVDFEYEQKRVRAFHRTLRRLHSSGAHHGLLCARNAIIEGLMKLVVEGHERFVYQPDKG